MVETLDGEEWRGVEGYELYQVSNCGRVKSLNYRRTGEEKLLRPRTTKNGYLRVYLRKDGKRKMFLVHRLVATAFVENPMPLFYTDINHKDEVKTNNAASNLEWCTRAYNINFGTHNARVAAAKSKRVGQFTLEGELIREWPSTAECHRNGYHSGNVSACCNNKYLTQAGNNVYKGYIWRYLS